MKRGIPMLMLLPFLLLSSYSSKSLAQEVYNAEVATAYNKHIFAFAIEEDRLLTLKGVRTASMAHVAMHDALNAIDHRYTQYAYQGLSETADPIAAAAQAAFEVIVAQFPNKRDALEAELQEWLDTVDEGTPKQDGIALGKATADAVLKARENDKFDGEAEYVWHPMAPGVYAEFKEHSGTPKGFVFGAGWAKARPFMLPTQDHFRSPPPPDINSDAYTEAYNEVKAYGRHESDVRTDDQAHLAMWWKDFVENSHNRLARQILIKENIGLWDACRTFALLNMSIYDAYVSVFDNKFHYNHWRPYTAIRWAEHDGNPSTEPDTAWNNLHKHTYAFPSYPSAHGTASAAAMTVLANITGLGDEYAFTMTTKAVDKAGPFSEKMPMNPPTRAFNSFSEAALECSLSRVYLGIHFRYDSIEGTILGSKIGEYACNNILTPVHESD